MPTLSSDDPDIKKNAPYRSGRRAAHKGHASRGRKERRLTVRSELREQPDVRKIARAIIQLAMAQAEAERQAQADAERQDGDNPEAPNE